MEATSKHVQVTRNIMRRKIETIKTRIHQLESMKDKLSESGRKFHLQLTMIRGVCKNEVPASKSVADELQVMLVSSLDIIENMYYDEDDEKVIIEIDKIIGWLSAYQAVLTTGLDTLNALSELTDDDCELI